MSPAQTVIVAVLGAVLGTTGLGGMVVFFKFFRDKRKDSLSTEQVDIDVTERLRKLANDAVKEIEQRMRDQDERHKAALVEQEERHREALKVRDRQIAELQADVDLCVATFREHGWQAPTLTHQGR